MLSWCLWFVVALVIAVPAAPGRLVEAGGHKLHLNCSGQGGPTVIVETGLGDFSFDWILVQRQVAMFARICSYDRDHRLPTREQQLHAWAAAPPLLEEVENSQRVVRRVFRALGRGVAERQPGCYSTGRPDAC
jgi:hypothetical protein